MKSANQQLEQSLREVLIRGSVQNSDMVTVDRICQIVLNRHFSHSPYHEDLMQEGRLGIITLVADGHYNPELSALNFCYTKVRNCMSNLQNQRRPANFTDIDYYETQEPEDEGRTVGPEGLKTTEVVTFIRARLSSWGVSPECHFYVCRFFGDRLGFRNPPPPPGEFPASLLADYEFFVGLLEILIVEEFTDTHVLKNSFWDLLDYLPYDSTTRTALLQLQKCISTEDIFLLAYTLAGRTLKLIPRPKMARTDTFFTIWADYQRFPDIAYLAQKYGKSRNVIVSIVSKFEEVESDLIV